MRLVLSLLALSAFAPQTDLLAEQRITESEYLAPLDQEEHPSVAALSADLGTARAERTRAATLVNPGIILEREVPDDLLEQTTVRLTWTPPLDGQRRLAITAAEAGVEAAQGRSATRKLELRLAMRRAFADWAVAEKRVSRLHHHAARADELVVQMARRAERGAVSGLAARRIKMVALQTQADLALVEAQLARARADALAWRPELRPSLEAALPELGQPPPRIDITNRPDVAALKAELEQLRIEEKLQGRYLTFPELALGWQRLEDGSSILEGPVFGLSWRVPIFDRNQADRAAARAKARALEAQLELLTRRAEQEVRGALAAYERLRQGAVSAALPVVETDMVITAATATYRLGESDTTALVETLRSVAATELATINLYSEALAAHRALERAAGQPLTMEEGASP